MEPQEVVNACLSNEEKRIVAGYCSLYIQTRKRIHSEYDNGTFSDWGDAEKLEQLRANGKDARLTDKGMALMRRLYQSNVSTSEQLVALLLHEDAGDIVADSTYYWLYKRRSWAKRRVVKVYYESEARWRTSSSLDLDMENLGDVFDVIPKEAFSAYQDKVGCTNACRKASPFDHPMLDIPILEIDKRDHFVFFDSKDSRGDTLQMMLRIDSAHFTNRILIGAIASEYWDDDSVPLLSARSELAAVLGKWFEQGGYPGFIESALEQVSKNKNASPTQKQDMSDCLTSPEGWVRTPGQLSLMELFQDHMSRLSLPDGDNSKEYIQAIQKQLNHYIDKPEFIHLLATFSTHWLAYLRIPNERVGNTTLYYSYVLARNILKGSSESVPKAVQDNRFSRLLNPGAEISLPMPMVGQAESEHFTFLPPDGTFFSHYPNKQLRLRRLLWTQLKTKNESMLSVDLNGFDGQKDRKAPLPFFIRYRMYQANPYKGTVGSSAPGAEDPSLHEDEPAVLPLSAEGSLAPGHISIKMQSSWLGHSETFRRVPDKKQSQQAHGFELVCRLRPRLGLRAFAYWLVLVSTVFLWVGLAQSPTSILNFSGENKDYMDMIQSIIPIMAVAFGLIANIDRETFIRKRLFRWLQRFVVVTIAIDFLFPWIVSYALKPYMDMGILDSFLKPICILVLTASLIYCIFFSAWILKNWAHEQLSYKVRNYLDKAGVIFYRDSSGSTAASMLGKILSYPGD